MIECSFKLPVSSFKLKNKSQSNAWMNSCGCRIILGVLLLTCAAFAQTSHVGANTNKSAGRVECASVKSKILTGATVPYCALLPPSYDTAKEKHFPVLYFL